MEATRADVIDDQRQGVTSKRMWYDHSLITCLVDRWRPETHTFHFRWGEMAPTLQDVSYLLGLPLSGEPIGPLEAPDNWDTDMAARFQGINPLSTQFAKEDHGPMFDWLQCFQVTLVPYICFSRQCVSPLYLAN